MNISYQSFGQLSKSFETKPHVYPKYPKTTTDPTYYEPQATRIANMKKASGLKLEGIYDFYKKDDVDKFSEDNFDKNISKAVVDPMYSNKLLREEVSQVANDMAFEAEKTINSKKSETQEKAQRIQENIKTAEVISKNTQTKDV